MKSNQSLAILLLLVLFLLGGCVSAPKSRPFNATAHPELERIEALAMRNSELSVFIVNNPGHSFGLIGALAAEAHMAPRRAWLREQVAEADFDHVETFRAALNEAMSQNGYQLAWPLGAEQASDSRVSRTAWGIRKSYPTPSDPDAQALLDVNFGFVGYASAGSGSSAPYRPTVVLTARLMDVEGKQELFQETLMYNDVFGGKDRIVINPDPDYAYANFDALKEAGATTIEGLRGAFEQVAAELAGQLQRP